MTIKPRPEATGCVSDPDAQGTSADEPGSPPHPAPSGEAPAAQEEEPKTQPNARALAPAAPPAPPAGPVSVDERS